MLGHFKPLNARVVERALVRCITQKSIVITSLGEQVCRYDMGSCFTDNALVYRLVDMCLELVRCPSNRCPPSVLLDFLYWLGKLVMHDQKRALESNLTLVSAFCVCVFFLHVLSVLL